jgi:hypothetical protein
VLAAPSRHDEALRQPLKRHQRPQCLAAGSEAFGEGVPQQGGRGGFDLGVEHRDGEGAPQALEQRVGGIEPVDDRVVRAGHAQRGDPQIVADTRAGDAAVAVEDPPRQPAGSRREGPALAARHVAKIEARLGRPGHRTGRPDR